MSIIGRVLKKYEDLSVTDYRGNITKSNPDVETGSLKSTTVRPKTNEELRGIIKDTIKEKGYNCDLNFIDTSLITDMSRMFSGSEFNGDISNWNTSNVTTMEDMFLGSKFNGDISKWDVSKVTNMESMFYRAKFNQNIGNWNVSNVTNMKYMFYDARFDKDISKWNVNNVTDMRWMFEESPLEFKYGSSGEELKRK